MKWFAIALLVTLAACGGAAQQRIDTARIPINAAATVILETDAALATYRSVPPEL